MLQIKNLTKIYKSKKTEPVKALDNVSLTFNSKGLVFLLGKSGSGKSTLLNVLGGLDKFDSGEIIIDGKSSKTFKEKDFDSYRNTYLGFIFQEYNILPEFTVYKNIEFALELQGKKADKQSINNLLEQVDLKGYGKRKPNELSGGQKQRIAIARALIKNPEIIMADEPTGALDSNTGKQVFDTLKKLSKEKLVIVVSHDREFAEYYADRIIELKDGKIISDTTKRKQEPTKLNEGFNIVDEKVIHIEKGHKYTKEEVEKLNNFLKNAEGDIILTSDTNLNTSVKKLAKIDDNGNREVFDSTKSTDFEVPSEKEKLKLIKSRLKFKDSFKMGASGLKTKKVRLFFTILLSAISLTLFGLADTMGSFNVKKSNYESLMELNVDTLNINKRKVIESGLYTYAQQANVGAADLKHLKEKFPNHSFKEVYDKTLSYSYFLDKPIDNYFYYVDQNNGITSLTEKDMENFKLSFVEGSNSRLPTNSKEVVITTYHLELFSEYGLRVSGLTIYPTSANEIINKEVTIFGEDYRIVGVLNTQTDLSKYDEIKETGNRSMTLGLYTLVSELQAKRNNGFNNLLIFNQHDLSEIMEDSGIMQSNEVGFVITSKEDAESFGFYSSEVFSTLGDEVIKNNNAIFFDKTKTSLKEDEVLISCETSIYKATTQNNFSIYYNSYNKIYEFNQNSYSTREELESAVRSYYNTAYKPDFGNTLPVIATNGGTPKETNLKVVGIYYNFSTNSNSESPMLIFKNQESIPSVFSDIFNKYNNIITKLNGNKGEDRELITYLSDYKSKTDTLVIRSEISDTLESFLETIEIMSKVFLYVGIGFAVFSALLLMNFIGISISYKKKEIGILRALGARGSDVYGIFLNESLIITLIDFVVAVLLTIGGVVILNSLMVQELGLSIKLLSFGLRQVGLLFGVSIIVALVASFLPTHKISRMKPIDAILDRKSR